VANAAPISALLCTVPEKEKSMMKLMACSGMCLLVFSLSYYFGAATRENSAMAKEASNAAAGKMEMVAHNVYFSLKDNSGSAKQKMVDACKKYLSGHPGTVFFAAGIVGDDFDRPVNDRDFDIGLHVIFKNKASHDQYQDAPKHLKFIEENKDSWSKVRVFDSYVEST
jgi:hypothetical protein